jgi:LmbE family N-acetylglucosaminyl deacetylase
MSNKIYTPEKVMVIMAHPDDIEYSCGGTIARWVREGAEIAYLLCTSGDVGIEEPGMTKSQATEIREAEQRNAAEFLGVKDVIFLREPDGMLENTMALRKKLVREIRRFKPEVVIAADPTMVWVSENYVNHPDHRAAGAATLDAVFPAAGQPNLFEELAEEGLTAHKVRKLYVSSFGQSGDTYVNITDTMDLKIAALQKHVSQMQNFSPEERMRERATELAKGKEMVYAEFFRVISLVSDEDFAKRRSS